MVDEGDLPVILEHLVIDMKYMEREFERQQRRWESERELLKAGHKRTREERDQAEKDADECEALANSCATQMHELQHKHEVEVAELNGRVAALHNLLLGKMMPPTSAAVHGSRVASPVTEEAESAVPCVNV